MDWLLKLHLIRFFGLYLTVVFCVSTWLRIRQYGIVLTLARRFPERWPRLSVLVRQHHNIFLTWGTVLPLVLTLTLLTAHTVASRWIWPQADFTVEKLLAIWPAVPVVAVTGLAMVAFDIYSTVSVGQMNEDELEKYFNQAEYWLRPWTAPVVRVFTLGYINPRKMVAEEVRKALVSASELLNTTLWWTITQTVLRLAFGLSLWTAYALEDWLRALVHSG